MLLYVKRIIKECNCYKISDFGIFLSLFDWLAVATPSVIPTAASSQVLSTVDNFPDTEVLNRNKDDIEKRRQVTKRPVR